MQPWSRHSSRNACRSRPRRRADGARVPPIAPRFEPVAIVGGGISGLAAAHYLESHRIPAVVIDPAPVLGGLLRTEYLEGCTIENGADSWLAAKPWARDLVAELGLASDVIGSNDAMRRIQVLRRGKLVPFPSGMQLVVPKRMRTVWTSPLFSFTTKVRMTADWFRGPQPPLPDRSVSELIRDHFGQGAVDYLAEPLLSGIYGGDPADLSAESVLPRFVERETRQGSLIRGAAAEPVPPGAVFETMRGGLGQLITALKPTRWVSGTAESIRQDGESCGVRVNGEWLRASHVIIAAPAYQSALILGDVEPELAKLLQSIRYSSAHIVAMAFRDIPRLQGFGLLVPRIEGKKLMAATWVSTKFKDRVPPGIQLIRAFFRQTTPDPFGELRKIVPLNRKPLFTRTYPWPQSLPQYSVGHKALVEQIEYRVALLPGLHLIGNAFHGVGIPDCVRLAKSVASRIAKPEQ